MIPILFHLYGPFSIQSYGFFIVLGILVFIFFVKKDRYFQSLKADTYIYSILYCAIFAALFGGRILSGLTDTHFASWQDFFSPVNAGFSILGSVIGVLLSTPVCLKLLNLPVVPSLDVIATHAPLVQAFGRIGCFFAGCCYGISGNFPWCITYTHALSLAPCHLSLHPTQLYSALSLFLIFLFLKTESQKNYKTPGKQMLLYLILISFERFFLDFWRQEHYINQHYNVVHIVSNNQLISFFIFLLSLFVYILIKYPYLNTKKN